MNDHEEWRTAVNGMSDTERAVTESECRRAFGICGDREDARYE